MLILTRRNGQTLRIGDDLEVTVLGARGNQVRSGIQAPQGLSAHREENYQKIASGVPAPSMLASGLMNTSDG